MTQAARKLLEQCTTHQTVVLHCAHTTDQSALVELMHQLELQRSKESLTSLECISPEKSSIGIEVVRTIQTQLRYAATAQRPRWIAFLHADTLTQTAQNALLKTLEEPPLHTVLFLSTAHPDKLLATVRSRALEFSESQLSSTLAITVPTLAAATQNISLAYTTLCTHSLAQACEQAEEFSDKEQAITTLQHLMQEIHQELQKGINSHQHTQRQREHLQLCLIALRQLEANCNVKLVMGELLLGFVKK